MAEFGHQVCDVQIERGGCVCDPVQHLLAFPRAASDCSVHDDQAFEARRGGDREREANQTAPVLDDEGDVGEVEVLDEMEDCVSMKIKIVGSVLARFVASAETVEVWSHDATGKGMLRVGGVVQEHGDHLAVEIGPGRFAVETKKDLRAVAGAGAFVDVGHS